MKELKFIHITKNAGTTIENLGKNKGIKWGRFHSEYGLYKPSPWHDTFIDIPEQIKNKYDWFVVVRNPYDRILSEYYCRHSGVGYNKKIVHNKNDFNNYLMNRILKRNLKGDHYTEQYKYIDNEVNIHILKFENLKEDFENLMVEYSIDLKLDIHTNKAPSSKTFTIDDFSSELIEVINTIYDKDFKLFDYEK
jgi:hypothetical protein